MFLVEHEYEADTFISQTRARLNDSLVRAPFRGFIKPLKVSDARPAWTIIHLKPVYPNPWLLLLIPIFIAVIFPGWGMVISAGIATCLLVMMVYAHSDDFQYRVFVLGLRKSGYKGAIKRLPLDQVIQLILEDVSERDI